MTTIKSNIMTNIINYLTEGYKGFFVTAAWVGGRNDVITLLVLADNLYIEVSRSNN